MSRLAIATCFVTIGMLSTCASDCEAQLFRGRFQRTTNQAFARVHQPEFSQPEYAQAQDSFAAIARPTNASSGLQPYQFETRAYFEPRAPKLSRLLDGKMSYKYRDPAEVDSRYIGGLHQSYFDNLAVPSGDIGIRGNTVNWRTW